MSSFGSSSLKSKSTFDYDVFLTFRTTNQFVDTFLVISLRDAGIKTFVDRQSTEAMTTDAGIKTFVDRQDFQAINPFDALEAMERSRIVIVIFTPEFLESDKCLERLVSIMRCHKTMNKRVLPVFCEVSQQEVRKQFVTGDEDLDWRRSAAAEAASLSGFTLSADFVKQINNFIAKLDEYFFPDLPRHLVGLQLRVKELLHLLDWGHICTEDAIRTRIIAIYGVGGIGKTTIAKAIYDRICGNFESRSFLANIKDVGEKDSGLVDLQKQLISDISEKECDEIHDVKMELSK